MGGFTETYVNELIEDCIREDWSVKQTKNILSDLDLDPEKEKELLRKVQVAKDLKKSAREEEKRKPMLLAEKNKEEAETFEAGIRNLTEEIARLKAKEIQRGLEAITKECIRLKISGTTIYGILRLMAIGNPEIKEAAAQIDHL